jgi:hypothetical protein
MIFFVVWDNVLPYSMQQRLDIIGYSGYRDIDRRDLLSLPFLL